ncbi:MAG TPA: helix-turn-helix transcriptional regulator [Bryobacteraceae bacterium]|nr:helix-turn-helix transcriptional regulator [Bryobacteraceae bacterium]
MRNDFFEFLNQVPFAGSPYRRARFFGSGEIRLAILSLLNEGPKHGYQLMKEISERSGGLYRASAGSVYPTLQQLEDEGLIEATQQNGRRVYTLTPTGRAELEKDPDTVRRIWERAENCEDWSRWMGPESFAIFGPLSQLGKSALRAAGRVGHGGSDRVRDILDRTRHELDAL